MSGRVNHHSVCQPYRVGQPLDEACEERDHSSCASCVLGYARLVLSNRNNIMKFIFLEV